MKSEELTGEYYDSFFRIVEKPLPEKLEACAAGVGKAVDDLTDEETAPLVDEMADALLSKMTELLQRTQSVPEIAQVQKQRPQEEDFSDQLGNYDRIDFLRQWNHSRTKIGQMLSLVQIEYDEEAIA